MLEYSITASRIDAHGSEARTKDAVLTLDTDLSGRPDAFNPAELFLASIAACMLKGIERVTPLLDFNLRGVSLTLRGVRQDAPPKMLSVTYEITVETDEPDARLDLLHKNVRKYGTISNTVAEALVLEGALVRKPAATATTPLSQPPGTAPLSGDRKTCTRMNKTSDCPALHEDSFREIDRDALLAPAISTHKPRILLLHGSLRARSYSRLVNEEAARILQRLGCETHSFDPVGLPLADGADETHPKVAELRDLVIWSEGMVWCSPERHGAMSGVMKTQIDWIPLSLGGVRPTQGKTLAVMQVCGGSQSFNAVNQLRILGRWMRLITIPNQSSVAKAFLEFDEAGRMAPSPYYDRIVDVMEELVKFTLLTCDRADYLVDRYSERKESPADLSKRVNQKSI